MYRVLDQTNWARKAHFNFFTSFDDPFFGLTSTVDVSLLVKASQKAGFPFFFRKHLRIPSRNQCCGGAGV